VPWALESLALIGSVDLAPDVRDEIFLMLNRISPGEREVFMRHGLLDFLMW